MPKKISTPEPEWSYPVIADDIGERPAQYKLIADDHTRLRVSERIGVLRIETLEADIALSRERGEHIIHATGTVRARLVQPCVKTLVEVTTDISEDFEAFFADKIKTPSFAKAKSDRENANHGEFPILDESEDPEPIINGQIDIGELAVQFLVLAVPLYPKALVEIDGDDAADPHMVKSNRPFMALKNWLTAKD